MEIQLKQLNVRFHFFHDGDPYHIETSPLICSANQYTGFHMIGSAMKELNANIARSLELEFANTENEQKLNPFLANFPI